MTSVYVLTSSCWRFEFI